MMRASNPARFSKTYVNVASGVDSITKKATGDLAGEKPWGESLSRNIFAQYLHKFVCK